MQQSMDIVHQLTNDRAVSLASTLLNLSSNFVEQTIFIICSLSFMQMNIIFGQSCVSFYPETFWCCLISFPHSLPIGLQQKIKPHLKIYPLGTSWFLLGVDILNKQINLVH